jgi:hypothetical protein
MSVKSVLMYILVFQMVSFLPAFPPTFCLLSSHPPFMLLHALRIIILLDLIILIILCKEYNLWSHLLCSFHQSPVTSSVLYQNILLSTLSLCSIMSETKFQTHTEPQSKVEFCIFKLLCF